MSGLSRRHVLAGMAAAGAAACTDSREREKAMKEQAEAILGMERLRTPWQTPDPFLFCMHHDDAYPAGNEKMGPAASLAGRQLGQDFGGKDGWSMYHGRQVPGFPQHPHRGFETVTLVRKGLIDHYDSAGAHARYGHGDVQWLTAGRGISHSEMFPLVRAEAPNPTELFQIWLNLPRASKKADPFFSMFWKEEIPEVVAEDASGRKTSVTVVAGKLGESAPPSPPPDSYASREDAQVAIWTIRMEAGAEWTLPAGPAGVNRRLYFFLGNELRIGDRAIPAKHYVDVRPEVALTLRAGAEPVEILMLQGRPIGEPVVQYGPFVMNSPEEIRQTIYEYQATRFGGWPWESDDPVHPREEGRFARLLDGREVRPSDGTPT